MNQLTCPNCYSISTTHHHTDWNHIDNTTGLQKAVSVFLCLDCKTLFVDDRTWQQIFKDVEDRKEDEEMLDKVKSIADFMGIQPEGNE